MLEMDSLTSNWPYNIKSGRPDPPIKGGWSRTFSPLQDSIRTVREKKNSTIWFFSHFMSFYPIYFIFIGWIGKDVKFFWVPRNFDFLPTNEIFAQKRQFSTFQKRPFLGVWCRKIDFCENDCIDMAYIMDSGQKTLYTTFPNIYSWKSAISAILFKKRFFSYLDQKRQFLNRKSVLEASKRVRWQNHGSPKSA